MLSAPLQAVLYSKILTTSQISNLDALTIKIMAPSLTCFKNNFITHSTTIQFIITLYHVYFFYLSIDTFQPLMPSHVFAK